VFYWELPVYQKARKLVIGVDRLINQLPNKPQAWVISQQLFDATTSIGANIAEGRGRHIGKEYERFLYSLIPWPLSLVP
jgi:four helix bundle protein